jgi:hypothetical protein
VRLRAADVLFDQVRIGVDGRDEAAGELVRGLGEALPEQVLGH